jgi:hypothetical protein
MRKTRISKQYGEGRNQVNIRKSIQIDIFQIIEEKEDCYGRRKGYVFQKVKRQKC